MIPLSAVVITSDNESTIGATLASIAWCDEILVVDSGSADQTQAICRQANCRVIERPFDGFAEQKTFAVAAARHDWVLVVDSDEVVSPELAAEIQDRLAADPPDALGYAIPISLIFLGKLLRHGGEFGKLHVRLFDRRAGHFTESQVHEKVIIDGPTAVLTQHILHNSYQDVEHYFDKFNRYTTLAAQQAAQQQTVNSRFMIVFRFPVAFVQLYLVRGLILDGYPGFVWALFSAFYATVKYVKLDEIRQRRKTGP